MKKHLGLFSVLVARALYDALQESVELLSKDTGAVTIYTPENTGSDCRHTIIMWFYPRHDNEEWAIVVKQTNHCVSVFLVLEKESIAKYQKHDEQMHRKPFIQVKIGHTEPMPQQGYVFFPQIQPLIKPLGNLTSNNQKRVAQTCILGKFFEKLSLKIQSLHEYDLDKFPVERNENFPHIIEALKEEGLIPKEALA